MTRRGQAALEYLVTYGWGFLAILVVLSTMAYFDMLNPTRYLPERCEFGAQLECVDVRLDTQPQPQFDGNVCLQFRNNFGEAIKIVGITTVDATQSLGPWWFNEAANLWSNMWLAPSIVQGNVTPILRMRFESPAIERFNDGDRISIPVTITFRRATPANSPLHNVTGEIYGTIQEGVPRFCGIP